VEGPEQTASGIVRHTAAFFAPAATRGGFVLGGDPLLKRTAEVGAEVLGVELYSLEWWHRYTCRLRLYKAVEASRRG